jgi:protein involved in polysaccharide export with SLBB domain
MKTKQLLWLILALCISRSMVALPQDANTDPLLKSGDVLSVFVWPYRDLNRWRVAIVDGKVNLPLVGKVQAEGLTIEEFRCVVQGRLRKQISKPQPNVSVEFADRLPVYLNFCPNQ